ncbi:hypothetical protein [Proteiniphilum sp. UBA1028]|jgi:hypothetical protein|uniref:hypothetical protein n=1 Tax=Proteiniphilum sp. UBA1028 TaxID=1947251 RepID=UPI000E98A877|nr:hypothetical protein [Proteiniphilum sp. UBA1028]HBG57527.1 hypothetical protein [Porphyromonadaceae bacterium]
MKKPPEIKINKFQLAVLLDKVNKEFYHFVIANSVYCSNCNAIAVEGIEVDEVFLTDLNDIKVRGRCRVCNGEVARLFEFGKDREFYDKANKLRDLSSLT